MVTVPSTFTLVYTFLTPNLGKVFQFDRYFSQLGGSTSKRNLANQVIDRGDGKGGRWSRLQICPPYSLGNYPPQLVPVPRDLNIGETREPGGLIQGQIYNPDGGTTKSYSKSLGINCEVFYHLWDILRNPLQAILSGDKSYHQNKVTNITLSKSTMEPQKWLFGNYLFFGARPVFKVSILKLWGCTTKSNKANIDIHVSVRYEQLNSNW